MGDRKQADVVDHDQLGPQDPGDGFGDGVVGAVGADEDAEVFEGEPGDPAAGLDDGLAEGFEEERLPGPGRVRRRPGSPGGAPIPGSATPVGWGRGWRTRAGSQAAKVLPVGNPAALRRVASMDRPRPATSSTNRALMTSAGSQRCAFAVAISSGASARAYGIFSCRISCSTSTGSAGAAVTRSPPASRRRPQGSP